MEGFTIGMLHSLQSKGDGPLVTAIIATYNRANLVGNAIESILKQTYGNIEVIVVDDGSTDDTQDVVRQFGERVRVIYQNNAGPGAARNRGIAMANGDIIAFLDSDDLWLPLKIERQVAVLQSVGESVPCCVCDAEMRFIGRPTATSFQNFLLKPTLDEGIWLNASEVLTSRFMLFNQIVAVRRSALEAVGGFNEELPFLEDYHLALRLSLLGPFAFIREPLAIWNQGSEGSLSAVAHQQEMRLRKLEVKLRTDVLESLEPVTNREPLKRQMRGALIKARRKLWIADLRQAHSLRSSTIGYLLERLEHYSDAASRRSPWFIDMKTAPLTEHRPTFQ
jgi:glycosyltransferase involved in cell wall biosynthesis